MNSSMILPLVFSAAVTYGMHSTLSLLLAWCFDKSGCIGSLALQERLWKSAVVVPLLTTVVQLSWADAQPVWEWQLGSAATIAPEQTAENQTTDDRPVVGVVTNSIDAHVAESGLTTSASLPQQVAAPVSVDEWESGRVSEPVSLPKGRFSGMPLVDVDVLRESSVSPSLAAELITPIPDSVLSVRTEESPFSALSYLQRWVPIALFLVSACGMFCLVYCARQLRSQLQQSETLSDGEAYDLLHSLCQSHRVHQVPRLVRSSGFAEPAAVGVFSPTIVLPTGLESQLNSAELRALLAHELAHLVRRDTAWMWIGHVVRYCLPWQPLNLLAVRRWRMIAEFQCDQWATGGDEVERVTLAKVLARIAEWKSAGKIGFAASAAGPPLSQRITRLLSNQIPTDRWQCGWRCRVSRLMVVAVVASMALFAPRTMHISSASATTPSGVVTVDQPDSKVDTSPASLSQPSDTELSLVREEFNALASDLTLALELLSKQEAAPDVTQQVTAVAKKLEQLRMKIRSLEKD